MSKHAAKNSCPLCGKPANPEHLPFCSQGCRDRDLLNWLGEGYAIPGAPVEFDEDGVGASNNNALDSER